MKNLAFHRTTEYGASQILAEGIKSMASRGWELPDYKEDPEGYENARQFIAAAGFKFQIRPLSWIQAYEAAESKCWMMRRDFREVQSRLNSVFVRTGGVETCWAEDGLTVAIDLDKVDADHMTDGCGKMDAGDGVEDLQVFGDIPASAVLGVVSDEWMEAHGFTVSTPEW